MKVGLMIISIFISINSYGDMEHKPGQGIQPSAEKLSLSRGCFKEMRYLGCGHPREDHGYFIACLANNRDQLSNNCQSFFQRLYEKKN